MTMASAVAKYCSSRNLVGEANFEQVARRVIKIYESGCTDVDAIIAELKRMDHN